MQQGHDPHGHSQHGMGSDSAHDGAMMRKHYMMLALNLGLSLAVMYFAMFTMIWSWGEFIQNLNFFYMALVMWAPMAIIMLLTMGSMYRNKRLNLVLYGVFAVLTVLSFYAIRDQSLIGDRAFLRSMIPHHAGAITMCERSSLKDPAVRELCYAPDGIVESQKREVAEMEALLRRQ